MPIYEYQCRKCGHKLEKLQRMGEAPLQDCPACEQPELRRLVSAAGFRLKGGGWYETDFKQGDKRNLVDSGKPESAGSASKADDPGKADAGTDGKSKEASTPA